MATIPMFAPDGSTGEIPVGNVQAAQNAGFKKAYTMTAPDGKTTGYIPEDRANDALKAGFKLGAPDQAQQGPKNAGFTPGNILSNVGTGLKELGQGAIQGLSDIGGAILPKAWGGDPLNNLQLVHHIVDPMQAQNTQANQAAADYHAASQLPAGPVRDAKMRDAALAYGGHILGSSLPMIGPYAANLGEQAGQGDVGGALAKGATQYLAPKAIAPIVEGVNRVGARAMLNGQTPEGAYESALKASTTKYSQAERESMIQTALDEGIPVSKGGLAKLGDLVDDLNQKVKAQIALDPNRPISTVPAINNLDSVRARFANQVTPQPDLAEINAAGQDFLTNPKVAPQGAGPGPGSLPASEAQAMKQGTYQTLGDKAYGEVKGSRIEAEKALARGLKDEIANQFPELNQLNAQESKLLDLQPALEQAVNRVSNHQAFGIGSPLMAAGAKAATGSNWIAAAVGTYKAVFDNPIIKSRLAIAVSKADKIPYAQAVARVQGFSTRLGQYSALQGTAASSGGNSANPPTQ